jgi:Uma2 family endonuclease
MTEPVLKKRYTPAEYYALEHEADYKSDYYDGEIFDMSGGTGTHSLISMNITGELRERLKGRSCTPYESNLRVKVEATGLRTYPDASVYCEAVRYDSEDPRNTTALNPTVVFEVLSPSTEAYDRGFKAEHYEQIVTLRAYLFVAQDRPHVEMHDRPPNGTWSIHRAVGLEASIRIEAIGVDLPLAEIYARVEFPPAPSPNLPRGRKRK